MARKRSRKSSSPRSRSVRKSKRTITKAKSDKARRTKSTRRVYYFGDGKADGAGNMKPLLGGKGANLAEMTRIGLPVPPGFTITTEVCIYFSENKRTYPKGLEAEVEAALAKVEKSIGKKLGDKERPLLVSVRSGARDSMPGMMDTILNLGMNDTVVEVVGRQTGNARFAWDSYRRFLQMYGDVVMESPYHYRCIASDRRMIGTLWFIDGNFVTRSSTSDGAPPVLAVSTRRRRDHAAE